MPEVLTKHPDVVMKLLEEAGGTCGPGQRQKILDKCPPSQFCSVPGGEMCVFGADQVGLMTQLSRPELQASVCAASQRDGCGVGAPSPGSPSWLAALAGVLLLARRYARVTPRRAPSSWRRRDSSAR